MSRHEHAGGRHDRQRAARFASPITLKCPSWERLYSGLRFGWLELRDGQWRGKVFNGTWCSVRRSLGTDLRAAQAYMDIHVGEPGVQGSWLNVSDQPRCPRCLVTIMTARSEAKDVVWRCGKCGRRHTPREEVFSAAHERPLVSSRA
jgi:hypothetical protein